MGSKQQFEGVYPREASILISFQWEGRRHRERIPHAPTTANLRAAARLRDDIVDAIRIGKFTLKDYEKHFPDSKWLKENRKTVGGNKVREVAQVWLKLAGLAETTLKEYSNTLNREFFPTFGDREIATIEYEEFALHVAHKKIKNAKTFNNVMTPIRGVFAYALKTSRVATDITAEIPTMKPLKAKPDPLDVREIEMVLAHLQKKKVDQWLNYFEFAFFSGLRPSELIAFKWGKVDFLRKKATIDAARVRAIDKDDKTHRERVIDLQTRAFNALLRQKKHTFLAGDLVFLNPENGNKLYDTNMPLQAWHETLKAVGIRDRDAKQTRHTFATMCLHAGVNPAYVAEQMGHVDKRMFFEVYAKWMEGDANALEMLKLDQLFSHKKAL
jgi:integrase